MEEKNIFNNEKQLASFLLNEETDTRTWGELRGAIDIPSIKAFNYNLENKNYSKALKDFVEYIKQSGIKFPTRYESFYDRDASDGYASYYRTFYTPCEKINYCVEIIKEQENLRFYERQVSNSQYRIRELKKYLEMEESYEKQVADRQNLVNELKKSLKIKENT